MEAMLDFDDGLNILVHPKVGMTLALFPFLRHLPGKWGDIYRRVIKARDHFVEVFIEESKVITFTQTE